VSTRIQIADYCPIKLKLKMLVINVTIPNLIVSLTTARRN